MPIYWKYFANFRPLGLNWKRKTWIKGGLFTLVANKYINFLNKNLLKIFLSTKSLNFDLVLVTASLDSLYVSSVKTPVKRATVIKLFLLTTHFQIFFTSLSYKVDLQLPIFFYYAQQQCYQLKSLFVFLTFQIKVDCFYFQHSSIAVTFFRGEKFYSRFII